MSAGARSIKGKSNDVRWRDLVHVEARYRRSIHLERDFLSADALAGYVITPLVRATLARVGDGLLRGGCRAWSFTGPYGSGKSAFAVFLANVFENSEHRGARARRMLEAVDSSLCRALFPRHAKPYLVPVLATGERKSLEAIVLRALAVSVEEYWDRKPAPKFSRQLGRAAFAAEQGHRIGAKEVVGYVEEFASRVTQSNRSRGVLLLIDEAGKALEYASHHPERSDVQLLQELAESASRSGDRAVLLGVFLHQAFEQYASRLGNTQRNEWAKVQGRFEDVPFQEAADQLLRLVAMALGTGEGSPSVKRAASTLVDDVLAAATSPGLPDKLKLRQLLHQTLPLHPLTALLLAPIFRSHVAQNERSLFAFLSSSEPGALQAFLDAPVTADSRLNTYRPDDLLSYIKYALGERLHRQGRQWAQMDAALARLPKDAGELEARVVRTVGLLGLVGESSGIRASERVIELAVADDSPADRKRVAAALEKLQAASILVYRRFRNAFQLWDGSDLDLDARAREARGNMDARASLVGLLSRAAPPRPLVARRHLFQTGTLRYFTVRYGDETALDGEWTREASGADGVVWILLPSSDAAAAQLKNRLNQRETWRGQGGNERPVVVGVMNEAGRVREVAVELGALEWVRTHTPELASDPVARRELEGRILEAESVIRSEMAGLLAGQRDSAWYHQAKVLPFLTGRELGSELSNIFDRVYASAPYIRNELLNRSQLSSAAAAARRELMLAMVNGSEKPNLGIQGFPPELSMYRSVMEVHGLHKNVRGRWRLCAPAREARMASTLSAILETLGSDGSRLPVTRVYDVLRRPPYGLKDGVIPVLLVWTLLVHDAEISLYEEGAFVPVVDGPVLERIARAPELFEVQRFKIDGARQDFFEAYTGDEGASDRGPLPVVRQFVKVVQELPAFTRNTRELSGAAMRVRDALLKAREPGPLLFRDLPEACGFEALTASRGAELPAGFIQAVNGAVGELRAAYPRLLQRIREQIGRAFELPPDAQMMRAELCARSRHLLAVAADQQLRTFLIRASDDASDVDAWTVSVGTFLGGRPPESWSDADAQRLSVNLAVVARKFHALEAAFLEHQQSGLPEGSLAVRVAITEAGQAEAERVVIVRREDRDGMDSMLERLREAVQAERGDAPRETVVASLAQVMRELLAEMDPEVVVEGRGK